MKLGICVKSIEHGYVIVNETVQGEQYLPEGSTLTARNRFEYKDTASIDVFRLNSTGGEKLTPPVIIFRDDLRESKIKITKDGWFTAIHIVVPTKQWVMRELDKKNSIIRTYDRVYYTDGKDILLCVKGELRHSNLNDLLNEISDNTTISRTESDYIFIANLQDRLKESYTELFKNRMYNGGCKTNSCEANRLQTGINLIKHYVRHGQLAEAERIIEKIDYFNNPIPNIKDTRLNNDCGCK